MAIDLSERSRERIDAVADTVLNSPRKVTAYALQVAAVVKELAAEREAAELVSRIAMMERAARA